MISVHFSGFLKCGSNDAMICVVSSSILSSGCLRQLIDLGLRVTDFLYRKQITVDSDTRRKSKFRALTQPLLKDCRTTSKTACSRNALGKGRTSARSSGRGSAQSSSGWKNGHQKYHVERTLSHQIISHIISHLISRQRTRENIADG